MDRIPVKTGAAPMVTTVPTATPVRAAAAKKAVWYAAAAARRRPAGTGCASRGRPGHAARRRAAPREEAEDGTGLQGMADRLAALGGTLRIRSQPGHGTILTGRLPVPGHDGSR
jgi:hypothetical protein